MKDFFQLLPSYSSFLLSEKLTTFCQIYLQRAALLNHPLLGVEANSGEEQQVAFLEKDLFNLLNCLESGKGKEYILERIGRWKNNELSLLGRNMEGVSYIVTSINISKFTFIKLLKDYSSDVEVREQILIELVEFYSFYFLKLIEAFGEMAQDRILEEKRFTESIIHHCVDGISAFDTAWRVTEWNPAMEKINHISRDQIIGKSFYDLLPEYAQSEEAILAQKVLEGQAVYLADRPYKVGKGWYEAHMVPLYNKEHQVIGALSITHDITQRKQAELQLQEDRYFIESLANTSPDVITVYDLEKGTNIYSSKEIYDLLGYSPEQLAALKSKGVQGLVEVIHPQDLPVVISFLESYKTYTKTEARDLEYRIKDNKGQYRWIMDRYNIFKRSEKGLPIQIIGVARDNTARKKAEEELHETNEALLRAEELLKEANNELEERVQLRTAELVENNEQLKRINEDLDNFIYMASHDLKSPIANMEGLVKAFTKKLKAKFSLHEGEGQMLALIEASIHRLKSTIASLTEIAKAQKEVVEEEVVSINAFLEEIAEDLVKLSGSIGVEIQKHIEVNELKIAPKHLRSILYNLISNAIKFRSPSRPPQIHLTTRLEDHYLILMVEDNGIGIEENNLQKLFTMFKRFHTSVEGTGIGLYIIKRIIENRGGKIEVESVLGKGTKFSVWLPYKL